MKMNKIKDSKFKINVFSNLIIKTLGAIIPFVLSPFISRALLPEGLGSYTYASSIVSYFSIIIAFGFLNYGTKKIAELRKTDVEKSHLFWNITYVKIALLLLTSILYFLIFNVFDLTKGFDKTIYYALYISLVGVALDTTFYFQGIEKMFGFSLVNLVVNLIYTFLVIFFVKTPGDLLFYTILKSSIILLTSLASIPLIAKEIKYIPKPSWKSLKTIFIESLAFFVPSLILTITPIIDQTMLGSITNTTEVGYYEAANKIKTIALVFTAAISSILLSRVSFLKSSKKNEDAHNKILSSLDASLFILLPLVVGIALVAKLFIPLYYGEDFTNSVNVMYWLIPSTLFSSITTLLLFGYYFATGKTKRVTIIILICDAINVLTNIVAIKYLGAVGAAITSSAANCLMTVLCIVYSWKDIKYSKLSNNLVKYIFSIFVMVLATTILERALTIAHFNNQPIKLVLMIFVAIFAYFATFLAIKNYNLLSSSNNKATKKKNNLTICHYSFGLPKYKSGGVPAFANRLINLQHEDNNIIFLYPGHYCKRNKDPHIKAGGLYNSDHRFKCFEIINPKMIPICNGVNNIDSYISDYPIKMWNEFFKNNKIDIIHVHSLFGIDKNLLLACKKNNVKTIFTSHDVFGLCPKAVPLFMDQCGLKPSQLCAECSKYAISEKQNRVLQSNFYNKIKNLFFVKLFRSLKVHKRVKLDSNTTNISKEDIISLSKTKSDKYSILQKYYVDILNEFDYIHFNSTLSEKVFSKFIKPKDSSVKLISNGFIEDRRSLHKKEVNHDLINFVILGTGNGMYEIIDILNELWNEGHKNFKLSIYSKNSCRGKKFIQKFDSYTIDDEEEIFNESDCLLFNEVSFASFSFIVCEALSYGVPCLTCGNVGANQLVKQTGGGIVSLHKDLKDNLLNVLNNPDIITSWQKNLASSNIDFKDDDFIDLYKKIISKKSK